MKARGDSLGPQERPKWVTICSITSMERKGVWCLGEEMCAQRMLAVCVWQSEKTSRSMKCNSSWSKWSKKPSWGVWEVCDWGEVHTRQDRKDFYAGSEQSGQGRQLPCCFTKGPEGTCQKKVCLLQASTEPPSLIPDVATKSPPHWCMGQLSSPLSPPPPPRPHPCLPNSHSFWSGCRRSQKLKLLLQQGHSMKNCCKLLTLLLPIL